MRRTYDVISYDVWGNAKDGYEVNQAFHTPHSIVVDENESDASIIRKLKSIEYLNPKTRVKFTVESNDEFSIYIERERDGYPVCELRLNEDESEEK